MRFLQREVVRLFDLTALDKKQSQDRALPGRPHSPRRGLLRSRGSRPSSPGSAWPTNRTSRRAWEAGPAASPGRV